MGFTMNATDYRVKNSYTKQVESVDLRGIRNETVRVVTQLKPARVAARAALRQALEKFPERVQLSPKQVRAAICELSLPAGIEKLALASVTDESGSRAKLFKAAANGLEKTFTQLEKLTKKSLVLQGETLAQSNPTALGVAMFRAAMSINRSEAQG